ncbi:MAG: hypothetical protein H7X75_01860 [Burkholderiaceae bacterium]|nr:hypothetical protein [Burkholderiaceae bacterium]
MPFFLHGCNAYAEGIGERLSTIEVPPTWFAIIWPRVHVSTREIFNDTGLTRNSKATKMRALSVAADFVAAENSARGLPANTFEISSLGVNDLELVARRRYPVIDQALSWLERFGVARMTGSGSAVFLAAESRAQAELAVADLPQEWRGWVVEGATEHPLAAW